ncbi:E3 ubiquitin-protein ligase TRIM21-like isoform X2 [Trematomus bernacchii]|nr:E3 ubiquitin-protein ligase TRIM21-like isoform X2 [Trematomus bernacchii]XP_034006036.1 E3 ubiquitin-protein ligase TRIM21-like isoform X2 [Trematomus bernacchii]
MSSMQVCYCGWSKVTTYQGLRIHQGKMGCTPRGMGIPEREQIGFPNYITSSNIGSNSWITPVRKEITSTSDKSMQICYCGWSNVTTYQGLRIHQGKMGCTPKGMGIPESDQFRFKGYKYTNADSGPSIKIDKTLTPPQHSKTHQNTNNVRRALDFSTGAQQVEQLYWELPTTSIAFQLKERERERETEKEMEKEREAQKLQKMRQDRIRADLQQKIQLREQKISEVTSSVKDCMGGLDAEWLEINSVFSEVMKVVEDSRKKALQPLEERRQRVSREGLDQVKKLQNEIDKIRKTIDELDKNADLQALPKTFLDESRDWKNFTVDTSFSFGSLRTTISSMMEQIHQELEKLSSVELKRIPRYAVDVKLDPTTAHQCLVLSPDGKTVSDGGNDQKVPDAPQRFDVLGSILGINRLTSGKSYWEVEVTNKSGWDLGVARRNANRKGKLSVNSESGYWVVVHYEDKKYAALTVPPVSLPLKEKPEKVGVFVDYEERLVSFYNVMAQSHIYTFTECMFSDLILPYFSPHPKQNEKNSHPLIISPVKKQL